jgi:LCP family protein required for cell wall assembly
MPNQQRPGAGTGTGARPAPARRQSRARWVAAISSGVILTVATTGFVVNEHLSGNIRIVSIGGTTGHHTAPVSGSSAMNLLLLGSDTRAGQGPGFGANDHVGLSDTALLLHINAGRDAATAVSIPRDLLVDRPACQQAGGGWSAPATGVQFNTALAVGGPACSVRTVEQLTGLPVDHFMEIDFDGFQHMVDVLGGVTVCLPHAVHDVDSHLDLPAGRHLVTGAQALAFVRDRHGIGDGSDLDRIRMQHQFLASLLQKASSDGVLSSPAALYDLADAATKSLTTDPALGSVSALLTFASSLRGLTPGQVTFSTLPAEPDPRNPNRLVPDQNADDQLYQQLSGDTAPPAPGTGGATPLPNVNPASVQVQVLNGTALPGEAGIVARALRGQGFDVVAVGNAPRTGQPGSVVSYPPNLAAAADAVLRALPTENGVGSAVARADGSGTTGTAVTVVLGPPATPASAAATSVDVTGPARLGSTDVCADNP